MTRLTAPFVNKERLSPNAAVAVFSMPAIVIRIVKMPTPINQRGKIVKSVARQYYKKRMNQNIAAIESVNRNKLRGNPELIFKRE